MLALVFYFQTIESTQNPWKGEDRWKSLYVTLSDYHYIYVLRVVVIEKGVGMKEERRGNERETPSKKTMLASLAPSIVS